MTAPRTSSRVAARPSTPRKPYRFSQTATPDQLLPVPAKQALMAVDEARVGR